MFVDDRKNTSEYLNLCKEIKQKKKQLNQRNWDMDDDDWFEYSWDMNVIKELMGMREKLEKEMGLFD